MDFGLIGKKALVTGSFQAKTQRTLFRVLCRSDPLGLHMEFGSLNHCLLTSSVAIGHFIERQGG